MPNTDNTGFVMNPSTYKQVVENAKKLLEVAEDLGGLEGLGDQLTELKNAVDGYEQQFTDINDKLTEHDQKFVGYDESIGKIDQIQDDVNNMKDTVSSNNESIGKLEETVKNLDEAILNPPEGSDGSLVSSENGTKVIGVHINTTNSEVNNLIADYNQGVTFEYKNTTVIGLKGKTGMTGDYCCVMTVKKDSPIDGETPETITADEFQFAYGTDGVYLFKRSANSDGSWGEWLGMPEGTAVEIRQQFVESDTEPVDQQTGEYWFENLTEDTTE